MKLTKTKIILLAVIAITLLFIAITPNSVYAASDFEYNLSKGEVTIKSYNNKSATSVTIPDKINGYPVKEIGLDAFKGCTNLKSITLNNGLVKIGNSAFNGCTNLTSISFPSTVKEIGSSAFAGCSKLTSVNLGKVEKIQDCAFQNCRSLSTITYPSSVNRIGGRSFASTNLTQVVVPYTVKSIGDSAFSECKNLKTAIINANIGILNSNIFMNCTSLTNVTLSNNIEYTEFSIFDGCTSLKEITLPEKLRYIKPSLFNNCPNLIKVVFPEDALFSNGSRTNLFGSSHNPNLKLYVVRGSAAEELAFNQGIAYVYSPINISKCSISGISDKTYTGKALYQNIKITRKGATLRNGTDYMVGYKNNQVPGTAVITITGKGNYTGTITKTFKIQVAKASGLKAKSQTTTSIKLSWSKKTGVSKYELYQYNSSKKKWKKIATTSKTTYTIKKLKTATTYKFRIRAYATINKKNYYGSYSSTLSTSTKTKTPKISKITSKKKKATLSWKKVSGASGYEIYMATSKKGKYKKVKTISSGKTTKYTKGSLKKNKKYYFKIRTYRKVSGKKIYSSYSSIKNVKAK